MNPSTSFAQKLDSGWSQAQLMQHYALTEREYERIIVCLDRLRS